MAGKGLLLAMSSVLPFPVLRVPEVPESPSRGHRGAGCTASETAAGKEKQAGEVVALGEENFTVCSCSLGEPPPQSAVHPEDKAAYLLCLTTAGFAVPCLGPKGRAQGRTE